MNKLSYLLIFVSTLILGEVALASDWTLKVNREGRAASKQYCYTDFEIDMEGNWSANSKYSNGHQVESIRLSSVMVIKTKDNKDIIIIPQNHHVKGSYGGSAREKHTVMTGKLPKEITVQISKGNTSYSCSKVSDLTKLRETAEVAKWVLSLF